MGRRVGGLKNCEGSGRINLREKKGRYGKAGQKRQSLYCGMSYKGNNERESKGIVLMEAFFGWKPTGKKRGSITGFRSSFKGDLKIQSVKRDSVPWHG